MEKQSKKIIIAKYKELLVPKNLLPLQLRFKTGNMIEYHIDTKNPDLDKLKGLLNQWFIGLDIIEIKDL